MSQTEDSFIDDTYAGQAGLLERAGISQTAILSHKEFTMLRAIAVTISTFFLLVMPAYPTEGEAVSKSQEAASAWLALTDTGKYAQSWDAAALSFKTAITKSDWEKALESVRSPLGTMKSRKLKTATFTLTLPDAPAGEYVVIQYSTDFENKASAIETVTMTLDKDGFWRVSGYFIK